MTSVRSPPSPREPVRRADRGGERVDAGLERLVAQESGAERLERGHRELLGGGLGEALLDPLAQVVGGRGGAREREDRLRRRSFACEPRDPLGQHPRLARSGAADDQQRAAGVRDGLVLGGGEHLAN